MLARVPLSTRGGTDAVKPEVQPRWRAAAGGGGRRAAGGLGCPTCPPFMSFMFMAFFMPLPFSFLVFFFLQQHFLQMQKQQVMSRRPATTAMAINAHGGTAHTETPGQQRAPRSPDPEPRQKRAQTAAPRCPHPTFVTTH